MSWTYNGSDKLASTATHLFKTRSLPCRLAPYVMMTDPVRFPDIIGAAQKAPRYSALIYRHFGQANRLQVAKTLRQITFDRDMQFLIGKDIELAHVCGADGAHLPEIDLAFAKSLRAHYPSWVLSVAAHRVQTLADAASGELDAAILSPVFVGESPSAGVALGVEHFSELVGQARLPVFALGGIDPNNAEALKQSGAAGIAGISGFAG